MSEATAGTGQHKADEYEYCFSDDCPNETCHAYAHGYGDGRRLMLHDLREAIGADFKRAQLGLNV